jgi:hypothetical protein
MRWFALVGLLLLAACQQPQATGTGAGTGTSGPGEPTLGAALNDLPPDWSTKDGGSTSKYFKKEQEAAGKRVAAALVTACYEHIGDSGALDRCLRDGVVDAFDESGQGRSKCRSLTDLDPFSDCIIIGNAAVDLLQRFDADASLDEELWVGRRSLAAIMSKRVISAAIMACGSAKTETAAEDCAVDWYQTKLALPESLAKKCGEDLRAEDRTGCMTEASILRFVEEHTKRIRGTAI